MDISIIVPVYNGGLKIRGCLRALKHQKTKRAYEIIVVDDGSTDDSLKGLEAKGVRVIRQTNQGPAAARNLGVEKARGDIVLFTDADCEPVEDWVEQMARLLDDRRISGVKGSYLSRQRKMVARFVQFEYEGKYEKMKGETDIDFIDTYSAGFRKEDMLAVGKYDTRFPNASVEDQEFSFRMWEKGCRMVFNPEAKVYHTHADSILNYIKKKFRIGYWKAFVLKRHPKKIASDSHTPQLLKLEMAFALSAVFFAVLGVINAGFLWVALLSFTGFLVTTFPFVANLLRKDPEVALVSPFLLFARAVSLGFGLIAGAVRFSLFDPCVRSEIERTHKEEAPQTYRKVVE